jgi:hypothetical protein
MEPTHVIAPAGGITPDVIAFAVEGTFLAPSASATSYELGIGIGGDASTPGRRCVVRADSNGATTFGFADAGDQVLGAQACTLPEVAQPFGIWMIVNRGTGDVECRLVAGASISLSARNSGALPDVPAVAVIAAKVDANLENLAVYELGQ